MISPITKLTHSHNDLSHHQTNTLTQQSLPSPKLHTNTTISHITKVCIHPHNNQSNHQSYIHPQNNLFHHQTYTHLHNNLLSSPNLHLPSQQFLPSPTTYRDHYAHQHNVSHHQSLTETVSLTSTMSLITKVWQRLFHSPAQCLSSPKFDRELFHSPAQCLSSPKFDRDCYAHQHNVSHHQSLTETVTLTSTMSLIIKVWQRLTLTSTMSLITKVWQRLLRSPVQLSSPKFARHLNTHQHMGRVGVGSIWKPQLEVLVLPWWPSGQGGGHGHGVVGTLIQNVGAVISQWAHSLLLQYFHFLTWSWEDNTSVMWFWAACTHHNYFQYFI